MCTYKPYPVRKGTINSAYIFWAQSSSCKLSPASWVVTMATSGLVLSMSPTLCLSSHSSHTSYLDISPDYGEEQILFPQHLLAQVQACICLEWRAGVEEQYCFLRPCLPCHLQKCPVHDWGSGNKLSLSSCLKNVPSGPSKMALHNTYTIKFGLLWVQVPE